MSDYFFGQGKVYLSAAENPANPEGMFLIGNVPSLTLSLGSSNLRHATAGAATPLKMIPSSSPPAFDMTLESLSTYSLMTVLSGAETAVSGASVANDQIRAYRGLSSSVRHINLVSLTSVRNLANTVTYMAGRDYVIDLKFGSIFFPLTTTIPNNSLVSVDYTYAYHEKVSGFTTAKGKRWMRYEGVNLAQEDAPIVVDIFKVRIDPIDSMELISENFSSLNVTGRIFRDPLQPANASDGQFLRIRKV